MYRKLLIYLYFIYIIINVRIIYSYNNLIYTFENITDFISNSEYIYTYNKKKGFKKN